MKSKHWILLFAALVTVAAVAYIAIGGITRDSSVAAVYRDGELVNTIDLDRVEEPYTFTVTGEDGAENVVLVEPGQISVQSATCHDQVCVAHAPISDGVEPIVCLPHRLIIQIEKSGDDIADTAVGG